MEITHKEVVLSLGSDLGDKINNLNCAIKKMEHSLGRIRVISSIYETLPLEFQSNTTFYNLCLILDTNFSSNELLKELQRIEIEVGREKKTDKQGYASRIIDIDIIYFNDSIISTENLEVPHPKFRERNFVLIPLVEITPNKVDPITNLTNLQLLKNCIDKSAAVKITHHFSV